MADARGLSVAPRPGTDRGQAPLANPGTALRNGGAHPSDGAVDLGSEIVDIGLGGGSGEGEHPPLDGEDAEREEFAMEEAAKADIPGGSLGGVQWWGRSEVKVADRAQAGRMQGDIVRLGDRSDRGSETVTEAVDIGDGVGVELAQGGEAGDGGNGVGIEGTTVAEVTVA